MEWWWYMPVIPELRRESQMDLWEFEATLAYRVSSRTIRAITQRNSVSEKYIYIGRSQQDGSADKGTCTQLDHLSSIHWK